MTEVTQPKTYDFNSDTRPRLLMSEVILPKDRARKDYSLIKDLSSSIRENGLLCPIGVNFKSDGTKELIYGATRFKACLIIPEMKGLIPFIQFNNISPVEAKVAELEENITRRNLTWQEQIDNLDQIETLKRSIYGDKSSQNPGGWELKKTAELLGVSVGAVSTQVKFARKLKSRPDLAKRIDNLPLGAAMKVVEQIENAEKMEALHASGELQLTYELAHDNALDFLKRHKTNSIDLIVTDPPFGIDEIEDQRDTNGTSNYTANLKEHDNSTKVEVIKLLGLVVPEMARVLKPGSHLYMFFELELLGHMQTIFEQAELVIQHPTLIWDKGRTTNPFRGYNYPSSYEAILYAFKPPEPRRLSESCGSIIRVGAVHSSKKIHVFEKPLELLAGFIKRSSSFGDIVCDPFAGSGSTLIAAKQTGRKAVGCELDREHFLKAQDRLLREGATVK